MKKFKQLANIDKGLLLLAHFQGKTIQMRTGDTWVINPDPQWTPLTVYRVKPQPKIIYVDIYEDDSGIHGSASDKPKPKEDTGRCSRPNVKFIEVIEE